MFKFIYLLPTSLFIWACTGPQCLKGILDYRDKKNHYCNPVLSFSEPIDIHLNVIHEIQKNIEEKEKEDPTYSSWEDKNGNKHSGVLS